jgi:hypothetical protein
MYYCSEAVKFLPDIEQTIEFEACAGVGADGVIDGVAHSLTLGMIA